ncbi:MAG: (Fe-S)-binding protein [Ignavibacteriales bacterium]|nr:(Fe-S)-binding protein [Ignavibacteriales bacterium]
MPLTKERITNICDITLENLTKTPEGRLVLTCIQCGTCAGTCPYGDYMDYPPRRIIALLRLGELEEVFKSESLLNCVACYSCMAQCPRGIALTEVLLPLMKEEMFVKLSDVPAELQTALQNTLRYGNPQGISPRKRADWVKTAGVPVRILPTDPKPTDVLWFVECYTSFHPRGQDNSRAVAKLFHALGVDFAILGNDEYCAGECARLVGETGLFDTLRQRNMNLFRKYKFNQIVTGGAHAYDAFKYLYPCHGFNYPLDHTTTFFAKKLNELKPKLTKKLNYVATYHDSCCLGRHNGIYDDPRDLLRAIPGIKITEMYHNKITSQCCGGGGGGMWLDTYYKAKNMERLSEKRIKEAVATGADVLVVSCPYEISRFEDALKVMGYENKMIVRDIVELLAESLGEN